MGDDILSGRVIEDGCDCTSETTEACSVEENTKYSGHNLYTTKGIRVGNMAGCASLCFNDSKCKFWTYNPRVSKCWMKTSSRKESIYEGISLWTESLWGFRCFAGRTRESPNKWTHDKSRLPK